MIALSLSRIAHIVDGTIELASNARTAGAGPRAQDVLIDGPVVTDSRAAQPGSLYVARVGEHADGHLYAGAARDMGAVAMLGTRAVDELPTIVVPDVQEAFATLAHEVVGDVPGLNIIGITGSSGKTSTKDMLGQVLAADGPTVAPEGSFNSEVGVPLTACRVDLNTRHLVVEMGASGVGHIAYLTRITPPRIGIVLNVGHAHVGAFGSVQAIADTKAALVEALPADGVAVLNHDDARVSAMAQRTRARVVTVGCGEGADYRAVDIELDDVGRATFTVVTASTSSTVSLPVHGVHQVGNALAVLAAAVESGIDLSDAIRSLGRARAIARWRMEVRLLTGGITSINDAYNANPESMAAALVALAQMGGPDRSRRTVAVLGAMRELGSAGDAAHRGVGMRAGVEGIDLVIAVGTEAAPIADGAEKSGASTVRVGDVDEAFELLTQQLQDGDVVLFKSSRDSGLRYLGDRIVEHFKVEGAT